MSAVIPRREYAVRIGRLVLQVNTLDAARGLAAVLHGTIVTRRAEPWRPIGGAR